MTNQRGRIEGSAPPDLPATMERPAMATETGVPAMTLDELRVLSEKATPGPWTLGTAGYVGQPDFPIISPPIGAPIADFNGRPGAPEKDAADAAFIVAAVNYVRAALHESEARDD